MPDGIPHCQGVPGAAQRSVCARAWAARRGRRPRRMALRVTPLRQQPVEQEPERKDREAVSLGFPEMVMTTRVAFFIPVLHGKQIHFPKLHASVCGIGITRPPHLLGRRPLSWPSLWLRSINYADKLPVFTCPAWLCTHPALLGVRKAPEGFTESKQAGVGGRTPWTSPDLRLAGRGKG